VTAVSVARMSEAISGFCLHCSLHSGAALRDTASAMPIQRELKRWHGGMLFNALDAFGRNEEQRS
jgi:hypothetical protein